MRPFSKGSSAYLHRDPKLWANSASPKVVSDGDNLVKNRRLDKT